MKSKNAEGRREMNDVPRSFEMISFLSVNRGATCPIMLKINDNPKYKEFQENNKMILDT